MTTEQDERLWTVDDTSAYLGIPVQTLYWWRSTGTGPPARRVGKWIRYRPSDVRAWVDSLPTGLGA